MWRPRTLINGQFSGPGCLFGSVVINLPSRTWVQDGRRIPLVYQNPNGIGVQGEALSPRHNQVRVDVGFA